MKKLIFALLLALLCACGDDVTNVNGYTDEEVRALLDSSLINHNDTVYSQTTDTVYKMVIDTVTTKLIDTVYQRVNDTVTNDLVDTIYQRVMDTVYTTMFDTIYERVIDTVFTALNNVGISTEAPRDTILTLYDTTDGTITAKIYKGFIFGNTFYESKLYDYGAMLKRSCNSYVTAGITRWTGYNVYVANMCGQLSVPTWEGIGWSGASGDYLSRNDRRLPGWRWFNAKDANVMRDFLDVVIPENELVLLNVIYEQDCLYEFEANVATSDAPQLYSKGKTVKYICAYDL